MKIIFFIVFFTLLLEFFLRIITKIGKKRFKWLIDYKDEYPSLMKKKLKYL